MTQALAIITQSRRPHQTFRVGYNMPAREFETAQEVLDNARAVYARMHPQQPPVVAAAAVRQEPEPEVRPEPRKRRPHDFLFFRTRFTVERMARADGVWQKAAELVILSETALRHCVTVSDIEGPTRRRNIVAARFEVYYRMSNELGYSLHMIGKAVGGRDHSGVMHGIRRHEAAMQGVFYRRTHPRGLAKVAAE